MIKVWSLLNRCSLMHYLGLKSQRDNKQEGRACHEEEGLTSPQRHLSSWVTAASSAFTVLPGPADLLELLCFRASFCLFLAINGQEVLSRPQGTYLSNHLLGHSLSRSWNLLIDDFISTKGFKIQSSPFPYPSWSCSSAGCCLDVAAPAPSLKPTLLSLSQARGVFL